MARQIKLSGKLGRNKSVIVDNCWFEKLNQYRWHSQIWSDQKYKHIGYFNTEEKAALAYNIASKTRGEFSRINIL